QDPLGIVRSVWSLHAPRGWLDDDVVIDAPADDRQRNQDQDDAGHLNACDHGRDQPDSRHDGSHTEDLLTSPSHGLGLPKNDAATREAPRGPPPSASRRAPLEAPVLLGVKATLGLGGGPALPPIPACKTCPARRAL